jgi:heme A synthase
MKNTAPAPANLIAVFAASLVVLSLPGLTAAKHGLGGWLRTHVLIVAIVVVLLIALGALVVHVRAQPAGETLQDTLYRRLGSLNDYDCRGLCRWLAQSSPENQRALEAALDGTAPVQGGEEDE